MSGAGRYAPSPSGDLHIGNLRTAILVWLFARSTRRTFLMRVEDLDRERSSAAARYRQLTDLRAIGLSWDGDAERSAKRRSTGRPPTIRLRAEHRRYRVPDLVRRGF